MGATPAAGGAPAAREAAARPAAGFGTREVTGGAPVEGLTLASVSAGPGKAASRVTLKFQAGRAAAGFPSALPGYRVSYRDYPARLVIEAANVGLASPQGAGGAWAWRPLTGGAEGVHAHTSADGTTLRVYVYLRSRSRFRAMPDTKSRALVLEYEAVPAKPARTAYALYLPPARSQEELDTQLDELRGENLDAQPVLTADGRLAVQVGVTTSRERALELRRQVLAYSKPGVTDAVVAPQPLTGRVKLPK